MPLIFFPKNGCDPIMFALKEPSPFVSHTSKFRHQMPVYASSTRFIRKIRGIF
jgi:hypothetical protein